MEDLGPYRIRKRLAVGGMGEVYLAEKRGPEGFIKPVVVKCVLGKLANERSFIQLFLDEARLAALLNHPNIAQIYDFGIEEGVYFIAMEYVPGYTIDSIRRKLKSISAYMPVEHVAEIATQTLRGLHYAHTLTDGRGIGLGLVHRDVSPHNIMVSIDGVVKLVDFGIAKARDGLTRVRAKGAVGKFAYMSPEQAVEQPVDGRADVFSLGICLWELCTNERLFSSQLDEPPPYAEMHVLDRLTELRPDLPKPMQRILEKALTLSPDDRFGDAEEMQMELSRLQVALGHYGGPASLSRFIRNLVEGKIEDNTSGEMVEPVHKVPVSRRNSELVETERFEEVFGKNQNVLGRDLEDEPLEQNFPQNEKWRAVSEQMASEAASDASTDDIPAVPSSASSESTDQSSYEPPDLGAPHSQDVIQGLSGDMEPSPVEVNADALELDYSKTRSVDVPRARHTRDLVKPTRDLVSPYRASPAYFPVSTKKRRAIIRSILVVVVLGLLFALGVFQFRTRLFSYVQNVSSPSHASQNLKSDGAEIVALSSLYRVQSEPSGALLYLDGVERGQTPLELALLPDVEVELRLEMTGFAPEFRKIVGEVHPGVKLETVELKPASVLHMNSSPKGARVFIKEAKIEGVTPMDVAKLPLWRPVVIRFEKPGFESEERIVTPRPGERLEIDVRLNAIAKPQKEIKEEMLIEDELVD